MRKLIGSWLPIRVLVAYGESQAGQYALAMAFSCMLAMFPLVLAVLSLVGFAVRDPATEARAQMLIVHLFPGGAQPQLLDALYGVKRSAGWMGLLSIAGLLWSAGSIFSTMEFAFAQIFGTKQRDMLRRKLMGLAIMVLLAAWFYVVCELILLGAVYNRFRLDQPTANGLRSRDGSRRYQIGGN